MWEFLTAKDDRFDVLQAQCERLETAVADLTDERLNTVHPDTFDALTVRLDNIEAIHALARSDTEEVRLRVSAVAANLETLIQMVENNKRTQTLAIAEGIEKVSRAERRVKATVQRAQANLESLGLTDAGVEAEATDLDETDGGRVDKRREMQLLPTEVDPAEQPSSIPGVSAETLRRARGR